MSLNQDLTSSSGPNEAPYTKIFLGTQPRITHLKYIKQLLVLKLNSEAHYSKRVFQSKKQH